MKKRLNTLLLLPGLTFTTLCLREEVEFVAQPPVAFNDGTDNDAKRRLAIPAGD